MKNKNIILLFFGLLFAFSATAQKVKIKKGKITVDGILMLKTDRGIFTGEKSIYDLSANELVFIQWKSFVDATRTEIKYCEISFPDLDLKAEVEMHSFKGIFKLLLKNKLFEKDTLVKDKVVRFVKKYGLEFSKRRQEQNNGKVIIINEVPNRRKGLNISIGN